MNRRKFLAALGFGTVAAAAAASSVIDLEKLLWVPGEKTIFLPPTRPRINKYGTFEIEVVEINGGRDYSLNDFVVKNALHPDNRTPEIQRMIDASVKEMARRIDEDAFRAVMASFPAPAGSPTWDLMVGDYTATIEIGPTYDLQKPRRLGVIENILHG